MKKRIVSAERPTRRRITKKEETLLKSLGINIGVGGVVTIVRVDKKNRAMDVKID